MRCATSLQLQLVVRQRPDPMGSMAGGLTFAMKLLELCFRRVSSILGLAKCVLVQGLPILGWPKFGVVRKAIITTTEEWHSHHKSAIALCCAQLELAIASAADAMKNKSA